MSMMVQSRNVDMFRNNININNNNNNNNDNAKKTRRFVFWNTLFQVDSKYKPIKAIGKGAYGVVCSALNTETNKKVAIKKIYNVFHNPSDAVKLLRELKILRYIHHENVVALQDVMITSPKSSYNDIYMVYELMDTDLGQLIERPGVTLSNDYCKYFLFQLLRGLKYLHSANILHRDLKPQNLLINSNLELKIADFGLARTCKSEAQSMTDYVVTRWYRAPELMLNGYVYGASIDMWSVGCIFAEMLGRKPLFSGTDSINQLKLIIDVLGTQSQSDLEFVTSHRARRFLEQLPYTAGVKFGDLYPDADEMAIDLLKRMLVFNPSKRITVTEALQHPYMSDLYDPAQNPPALFPCDLEMVNTMRPDMLKETIWREMMSYHPIQRPRPRCIGSSICEFVDSHLRNTE